MNAARQRHNGFTLLEVAVYGLLISVVGLIVYALLNTGTRLYATNVATNHSHHSVRMSVLRLTRDVHAAVSAPRLLDAGGADVTPSVVSGAVVPQAGIRFQAYGGGPVSVSADVPMNSTTVPLNISSTDGNPVVPTVGQRLIVPLHQIEELITGVNGSGSLRTVTLQNSTTRSITDVGTNIIVAHYTQAVAYIVQDGELRFFPDFNGAPTDYVVVASGITSETPFSFPLGANGQPDTTRLKVQLAARDFDNSFSNRVNTRTRMLLDTEIPYRFLLSSQ